MAFFQWLEHTSPAVAIRQTTWAVPLFNTFHELGMALLVGSIIVVSLRLMGLAMTQRTAKEIAVETQRWTLAGLATMVTTGFLMFLPESVRWYGSAAFRVKMILLCCAILFHFTVFVRVARREDARAVQRLVGAAALALWFSVGWGGRAITFLE